MTVATATTAAIAFPLLGDLEEEFGLDAQTTSSNDTEELDLDEEPDPLDALDALLGESMALSAERTANVRQARALRDSRDAARERLRKGSVSDAEREIDKALISKVNEQLGEWKAVANVGVFHRYNCQCGSNHSVFVSLMVAQEHFREKGLRQLLTAGARRQGLPDTVLMREFRAESCSICASAMGWDFEKPASWVL